MAQFFKPQPKPKTSSTLELTIDRLDLHGVGIARHQGKTIFVEGAMPGERVKARLTDDKKQHGFAQLQKILTPSPERQAPFCATMPSAVVAVPSICPRVCSIQPRSPGCQDLFSRLAGLTIGEPEFVCASAGQGYRRVCRLAIKYDKKGRRAQVGFRRQKLSHDLVEVGSCPVLVSSLSALIEPVRSLCNQLKSFRDLGHIELCEADNGPLMLLRHNGQPGEGDLALLREFAARYQLPAICSAAGEPQPLTAGAAPHYRLGELTIGFLPGDFLQVNRTINEQMVATVLAWLAPEPTDKVLDLFCGLGNFTLPLAARAKEVVGVEGVMEMVLRARENAERNGLNNVRFFQSNLDEPFVHAPWAKEPFSLVLLDPARPGAAGSMPHLIKLAPKRLVYVSCNPVTAARDCQRTGRRLCPGAVGVVRHVSAYRSCRDYLAV